MTDDEIVHETYERILVPTDGSDHATAAARHALGLARTYDATVHALYVVDTGTSWLTVSKTEVRDSLREIGEGVGERALDDVVRLGEGYGVEVHTEVREGRPEAEILAAVEENDIDLVVMGTHSREWGGGGLVGSVAQRVVREARPPVMTVNALDHHQDDE